MAGPGSYKACYISATFTREVGILNVLTGRMAEAGISVFSILQVLFKDLSLLPDLRLIRELGHLDKYYC